jgi:signal peptidase II
MKFLPIIIVAVWVGLDQALKAWTVANIPCCYQWNQAVHVVPGFLSLVHATNIGAAWSLFSSATPVLIVLRLLAGVGILVWVIRSPKAPMQMIAYSLIAAGALGNSIDGLTRGFVVDMLWSHWISAIYIPMFHQGEFPIFNIADMGVFCGAALLLVSSLLNPEKAKSPAVMS